MRHQSASHSLFTTITEQERQQSCFLVFTSPLSEPRQIHCISTTVKSTSGNTERPSQPSLQPSANSKLATVSREHTVQPDRSRQTQIPCQWPNHPSNPDPHQRPGPGPRPQASAHQTLKKKDSERKEERNNETGGKMGLISCFPLRLDCSEWGLQEAAERSILLNSEQIWVQHQFICVFSSFKEMQRQLCLFSLQLALTSNLILPFHCSSLLAALGITNKSLEWQQSGRSEVNTRREQRSALLRLLGKRSTVNIVFFKGPKGWQAK